MGNKNWYEKNYVDVKQKEFIKAIIKEMQKASKDEILYLLFKTFSSENIDIDILQKMANSINWTEQRQEECSSRFPYKTFINNSNTVELSTNAESNEEQEKFLDDFRERPWFIDIPKNIKLTKDQRSEIYEILIHGFGEQAPILRALGYCSGVLPRYVNCVGNSIDFNNVEDVFELVGVMAKEEPICYNKIQEILQKNNPIYNEDIFRGVNFDICPWLIDNPDKFDEYNISDMKTLLLHIFERLDQIGTIDVFVNLQNESLKKYTSDLSVTKDGIGGIREQITETNDELDIAVLLAFYLNKLTKVNEITMYSRVLNNFEYNEELDKIIDSSSECVLPEYVAEYRKQRDLAEGKGNKIISVLKYLRGKDNYAGLMRESGMIQNEKLSQSNSQMESFSTFLMYWKNARSEEGFLEIKGDSRLDEFSSTFNQKIEDLLNSGCTLEEITNSFIYANNALDLEEQLYNTKKVLLQQIVEYSKKEEYKNKVVVQYEEHDFLKFDDIYELWKDDANRENGANLKEGLEELEKPLLNDIVQKFNNQINNLIKKGYSIGEIKEGIPDGGKKNEDFFDGFKKAINGILKNTSLTFEYIYELWQDDNNRKNGANFKANFQYKGLSGNVIKEFNERINKLIEKGNSIDEIKKGIPKDPEIFQEFKSDIEDFQKENIDSRTDDVLYVITNSYLLPMSFHTNIETLSGVRESLDKVDDSIKNYSSDESVYIPLNYNLVNGQMVQINGELEKLLAQKKKILQDSRETSSVTPTVENKTEGNQEDEFLDLELNLKIAIEMLINLGQPIETLKEKFNDGRDGRIIEYAIICKNKLNETKETTQENEVRPDSSKSRTMTEEVTVSGVNQAEHDIMADIERTTGTKKEGHEDE